MKAVLTEAARPEVRPQRRRCEPLRCALQPATVSHSRPLAANRLCQGGERSRVFSNASGPLPCSEVHIAARLRSSPSPLGATLASLPSRSCCRCPTPSGDGERQTENHEKDTVLVLDHRRTVPRVTGPCPASVGRIPRAAA